MKTKITKEMFLAKAKELDLYNDLFEGDNDIKVRAIDTISDNLVNIGYRWMTVDCDSWIEALYVHPKLSKTIILDFDVSFKKDIFNDMTNKTIDKIVENINYQISELNNLNNKLK